MLTIIDSGCGKHPRGKFTFTGSTAALVVCLITNLPLKGRYPTYICEHGHTHYLLLHPHQDDLTASPPACASAEGRVPPGRPD
jgi:hypothetical protein